MKIHPMLAVATICILLMLACTSPDNLSPYVTPFTATPPPGAQIYVLKTGDDANNCYTPATACLTVNGGVGKAIEGSLILVGEGTFVEDDPSSDAGLMLRDKTLTIRGAAFAGEPLTILSGGGTADTVTVTGSSIVSFEDIAITEGGGLGAGLYLAGDAEPSVRLLRVFIQDNAGVGVHVSGNGTAALEGDVIVRRNAGGIRNEGGTVVSVDSQIVENTGSAPAIHNLAPGVMKIGVTLIAGNVSSSSTGTAIYNETGASLGLDMSAITHNSLSPAASGADYAIYNDGGLALDNSTVSTNSGAGVASFGTLRLRFATVATNGGSGLIVGGATTDLINSIVENNGLQDCLFHAGSAAAITGIVLSDGSCATGAGAGYIRPPEGDYFLASLADNGGPTPTHALIEGSLAIDTATGDCPATDQRGELRPSGDACDAGAFEVQDDEATPFPISLLPTDTPTLEVPEPPRITFTLDTNCRLGPTTEYPTLGFFSAGDSAPIEGLSDPQGWYWVLLADGQTHCFVAGSTGTVSGETDGLPVIPSPALPVQAPPYLNLTVKLCSPNGFQVMLDWGDVKGELGYRIYRDGVLIATLGPDVTTYLDTLPDFKNHTYRVEAFNKDTAASTGTESSGECKT